MSGLDTLRNRLVVLIFAITAAAVGFVYLYVVPQLESSLTAEKLRRLERVGEDEGARLARALGGGAGAAELRRLIADISQETESRVTLLAVASRDGSPTPGFVITDSRGEGAATEGSYPAAGAALETGGVRSGIESIGGERVGASAVPVTVGGRTLGVAVLSSPLDEVDDNVALIRRQILIAGLIAIVAAGLVGFYAAGIVSRRLRRLQLAAETVARGDFSQPIPIESHDELGQLALAFNEMQRRLERLDSTRKEFIANASHELRTPIFSLGGFVELLETDEPSAKERRQFVAEMRGQVERLQKLTLDLLDLSRLDADAMEISREPVDLGALARETVAEFRARAQRRGSKLQLRGRGEALAMADPGRVAQIIRILIDNALTHTQEGSTVTVTADSGEAAAELIVGDDGRGIEPRAIDRVFDRFYTGDASAGSGLGLAIADQLASRMGGSLGVVSQRGFTAFTLSLPPADPSGPKQRRTRTRAAA